MISWFHLPLYTVLLALVELHAGHEVSIGLYEEQPLGRPIYNLQDYDPVVALYSSSRHIRSDTRWYSGYNVCLSLSVSHSICLQVQHSGRFIVF